MQDRNCENMDSKLGSLLCVLSLPLTSSEMWCLNYLLHKEVQGFWNNLQSTRFSGVCLTNQLLKSLDDSKLE